MDLPGTGYNIGPGECKEGITWIPSVIAKMSAETSWNATITVRYPTMTSPTKRLWTANARSLLDIWKRTISVRP